MSAVNFSPSAGPRSPALGVGICRPLRILGATLLALTVKFACCQVDSVRFPDQLSTAQRMIVSANELRAPKGAQKAVERAHATFCMNGMKWQRRKSNEHSTSVRIMD